MGVILLIDFGSTYTKMTAVDLDREDVVGRTQAASTVETDMTIALHRAYQQLLDQMGVSHLEPERKLACSSAAGGLRMVSSGLVPRLTTEAAKQAALGAGAKVVGVCSYRLTRSELEKLWQSRPDIILLAGGTDGGDEEVILHNARMLAESDHLSCPVVIAGNKVVASDIQSLFQAVAKDARVTENVMPEVGELNVEPARSTIREVFMERIVHAKGLDKAQEFVGSILMPTPMAVLNGARLLAEGTTEIDGVGDLIVVDVGGATTNIHSVCTGEPSQAGVVIKGLPEPYAKRTVEGDLGIRYNAHSILELAGEKRIRQHMLGTDETRHKLDLQAAVNYRSSHIDFVPQSEEELAIDIGLASTAVDIAIGRHAGTIETYYSPMGTIYIQRGKDLTGVSTVIGTGGIIAYGRNPRLVLEQVMFSEKNVLSLRPKKPELFIDELYILYAMGLLSQVNPEKAFRIMKKHLKRV